MSNRTTSINVNHGFNVVALAGMALAAFGSWSINASIGWCIIHGMFGWFYILYLLGGCGGGIGATNLF